MTAPHAVAPASRVQSAVPVPTREARLVDVRLRSYAVTWRTWWDIVEVESDDGAVGIGEWSDAGTVESAGPVMRRLARSLVGRAVSDTLDEVAERAERAARGTPGASRLATLTTLGGIDAALCDLQARRAGVPLWGPPAERRVACYANINRTIRRREPAEFGRVARQVVDAGFTTLKCAPFDFLVGTRRIRTGLDLVRAVRDAVGNEVELLLDLHGHLTVPDLLTVADELAELRPGWLEDCTELADVKGLGAIRDAVGCRVAGGELAASTGELAAVLEAGVLDVVLPDIKHAGGPRRAVALAVAAADAGAEVSLHNPTGPVSSAHSAALAAAIPAARILEFAVLEDRGRAQRVEPAERVESGSLVLPANRLGAGVALADPSATGASWSWTACADE